MRKLYRILLLLAVCLLTCCLAAIGLSLSSGRAGWFWLLPIGVLFCLGVIVALGLRGSRGGLVALLRGQFPPRSPKILRTVHQSAIDPSEAATTEIFVDLAHPIAQVSARFLSVAIDLSQVVGGKWWHPAADHKELGSGSRPSPVFNFDRPQLDRLMAPLSPMYLRIGGSESDKIFYSLNNDPIPPPGYQSVLTRSQWDALHAFCERNGCKLVFTLNAGPSSRNPDGTWNSGNAAALMQYAAAQGQRVHAWELGNELNIFFFVHGLKHQVSVEQYCRDLRLLRDLRDDYFPSSLLAGQGSAYVPVLGEMLGTFFGFSTEMLKTVGKFVDFFSWHYYPQQSRRCMMGTRRAYPSRLLDPCNLDEAAYWADKINSLRDRFAPGLPVWLGETGNAQCGGEPGLSETYLSGLWWLDELGLMARLGQQVVVRQSLTGMNYGLLDEASLTPRPDYWNSWLWKRLMGRIVYRVRVNGSRAVRAYVHSHPDGRDISMLVINLDPSKPAIIRAPQFSGQMGKQYILTSPDVLSEQVWLNGQLLSIYPDGQLPAISEMDWQGGDTIQLPALSYGFFVACT